MSRKAAAALLAAAITKAQAGGDDSPRTGATCPCCGAEKLRVETTKPWEGGIRIRYHVCANTRCLVAQVGQRVKSVEADLPQEINASQTNQDTSHSQRVG